MKEENNIGHFRKSYDKGTLDDDHKAMHPIELFEEWFNAAAAHPDIEEEAVRVIKLLPDFIPGEHKGEKVIVSYSLPIMFQVEPKKEKD